MTTADDDQTADEALREHLTVAASIAVVSLRTAGLDGPADAATDLLTSAPKMPRVVVVGETARGKSRLVNALVGAPDLSPVGPTETSSTYIDVVPLLDPQTRAHAVVLGHDGRRHEITLEEFSRLARDVRPEDDGLPAVGLELHAAVATPGVIVVDTPGIGGIGGSCAALSRELARAGGMLIFAIDAGSPVAATELGHLRACAASIEHVVVAVTMIDKYPTSWQTQVETVRRLMAGDDDLRRVRCVGVSAAAAESAATLVGPAAERIEQASGIPELRAMIEEVRAGASLVPALNSLRCSRFAFRSALADAARAAELTQSVGSDSVHDETARLRADLRALTEHRDRWAMDADVSFGRIRRELTSQIRVRCRDLERDGVERIESMPVLTKQRNYLKKLTDSLTVDFELMQRETHQELIDRLDELVGSLFGDEATMGDLIGEADADAADFEMRVQRARILQDAADPGLIMMASSGFNLGATRLGQYFTPTLGGIFVAGSYLALQLIFRGQRVERTKAVTAYREAVRDFQQQLVEMISEVIDTLRPELVAGYRKRVRTREETLTRALREADQLSRVGTDEQKRAQATALEQRKKLAARIRDIDDALSLVHRH